MPNDTPICELRGIQKTYDRGHGKQLRFSKTSTLRFVQRGRVPDRPVRLRKSTILRICAGLIEATQGQVRYHGEP